MTGHLERKRLDARLVVEHGDGFRLDLALDLEPGVTTALLGPNGAGKSTTVRALAGLRGLDAGHIQLGDRVLDDPENGVFVPPHRRRIGVVFQQHQLFDHLDVVDNVAFGPASLGLGRRAARSVADDWIERFGLRPLAGRRPAELSGGQAQQVALARTLAADPEAVLLDEPLAALDVATRARFRRLLADHLGDVGGPRVLITHDPTDAFLLADHLVVIEDGRVRQQGTGDEIRRHPTTPYVAALAGRNLVPGTVRDGQLQLDAEPTFSLQVAGSATSGRVLATIHPNAVALHARAPEGSPRNVWRTRIAASEPLGDTVRVSLEGPLPLGVDVTVESHERLGLGVGMEVWASVKATEIMVAPA
ncbi:MAG: sulfate/molybdate ABC transporter ATP-binding protein [Acidimicrobiales bacterium]